MLCAYEGRKARLPLSAGSWDLQAGPMSRSLCPHLGGRSSFHTVQLSSAQGSGVQAFVRMASQLWLALSRDNNGVRKRSLLILCNLLDNVILSDFSEILLFSYTKGKPVSRTLRTPDQKKNCPRNISVYITECTYIALCGTRSGSRFFKLVIDQ